MCRGGVAVVAGGGGVAGVGGCTSPCSGRGSSRGGLSSRWDGRLVVVLGASGG